MPARVMWRIAAPMISLGLILLGLGIAAAWNVHLQQQTASELFTREVNGMLIIDELHIQMREVRYRLNQFLRTHDRTLLKSIHELHLKADDLMSRAKVAARTPEEQRLTAVAEEGYEQFFSEFQKVLNQHPDLEQNDELNEIDPNVESTLARLADEQLTLRVLKPLQECVNFNHQVIDRTNEASHATAQHLKVGFLLLGICGGAAGLLMGTGIARAIGRSIIQLNVSVSGVAGRLADVTGPVRFTHTGDLAEIGTGLRRLEHNIEDVVERLQQRELELLRSEQLARVGQLAAGLAHELRNPLMPMKMLVQSAMERGAEGGLSGRSLEIINEEIQRMESSIHEFLDFARPPVPEKSWGDVREIVRQTIELIFARSCLANVRVETKLPEESVNANVDAKQFRQLVLNLLLNAIEAMPDGGRVQVIVEQPRTDPRHIEADLNSAFPTDDVTDVIFTEHDALRLKRRFERPPSKPTPQGFLLRVIDDGAGIPDEVYSKIFQPFVTSKETGTGLGLSVCQRIANAHQGVLSARNLQPRGAEFLLWIPFGVPNSEQSHPN